MGKILCLSAMAVLSGHVLADPDFTRMNQILQGEKPQNVTETGIPGLYEFTLGPEVFYISKDGRYLIQGELMDLQTKQNLTEHKRAVSRIKVLSAMNPKDMIIYSPKGERKHIVYVFTDVDCGYCRMLHQHIDGYTDRGIEIRYLSFPRAGIGSESYKEAVNVWCADDRKKALTEAKSGKAVNSKACNAPVRQQYQAGLSMGISGTPALILEDGTLVPGFVRPEKLAAMIEQHKQAEADTKHTKNLK